METSGGYVRLHRKMLQNPIWTQLKPGVLKVAVYFLLRANYRPTQWYDGVAEVSIPAGSFITSYASAAVECGLTVQQIRNTFRHLERTHFAAFRRTHRWTLVSISNWASYQATSEEENTADNGVLSTRSNFEPTTDKELRTKTTTCSSDDERVGVLCSIDNPPFETTEPGALFPVEPIRRKSPARNITPEQEGWFDSWWSEYWRLDAKKAARDAFRKHVQTGARFQEVMTATRAQKPSMLAREESKRPMPTTWLNGERWNDATEGAGQQPQAINASPYKNWQPPAARNA